MKSFKRQLSFLIGALGLLVAARLPSHLFVSKQTKAEDFFSEAKLRDENASRETFPSIANCKRPIQGAITFSAHMYVHEAFFNHLALEKNASEAIDKHLRYLNGYYNSSRREGFRAHLLGRPEFRIERIDKVTYGHSLEFDHLAGDPQSYPERFRKDTLIQPTDEARRISYSAEQGVVICSDEEARVIKTVKIALPRDPYLAFWSVRKTERRPLAFHRHKEVTNFCAHPQIASLRQPANYWYVWNPSAKGKDDRGVEFDCSRVLEEGTDYLVTEAKLKIAELPQSSVTFDEALKVKDWQTSIVFGFVRDGDSKSLMNGVKPFLEGKTIAQLQSIDPETLGDVDASMYALLKFLDGVDEISDIQNGSVKARETHFEIELETKLKTSGRSLRYSIYFGPTAEWQEKELHWPFIRSALDSSQFIFFVGHSGMGKGMNFQNLKEKLGMSDNDVAISMKRQKYQMLGIISCYSMYYFGSDYLQLRKGFERTTDLLLVGSEQYLFALPLAYFSYLDMKAAGAKVSLRKAMSLFLKDDEAVYVSRQI